MPDLGYADSASNTTEFGSLMFLIQQAMAQISTATLGEVVTPPYDRNGTPITPGSAVPIGFVDVKPLVNQANGDGSANPHGTVYRLSYHRYQGGHGAFISDPKVGDQGKIVISERDTSVVKQTNAQGNQGSNRRFDKADGTFFGCTQGGTAPTQFFSWLSQGFNLTDAFGNTIVGSALGVVINGVTIPRGGISFDLKTHVHAQMPDSHGDTEVPTLAPTNGS